MTSRSLFFDRAIGRRLYLIVLTMALGVLGILAFSAAAVEKQAAATIGIAFSVAETASAASDMSSRVTEISAEAEQTEEYARSVRENASALEVAVAELRHAVIKVVRTSADEAITGIARVVRSICPAG